MKWVYYVGLVLPFFEKMGRREAGKTSSRKGAKALMLKTGDGSKS